MAIYDLTHYDGVLAFGEVIRHLYLAHGWVSRAWTWVEGLFTPGRDFLMARNGAEMQRHLKALLADEAMAHELAAHGLQTIRTRHTCAHRVDELMAICELTGVRPVAAEVTCAAD
jgi:spore maturation protein CgeB